MIIRFIRYNVMYLICELVVCLWMDVFFLWMVEIRICLLKCWIRIYLLNVDIDLCFKWFFKNIFVVFYISYFNIKGKE